MSSASLPAFKYHPDPVATGHIKNSDTVCVCCQQPKGYVYVGPVYGPSQLRDRLCPWCIASGLAASRFQCFFCVEDSLLDAGLSRGIVIEVTRRTPGYNSWQQQDWLACCDDACEFHGDATPGEVAAMAGETLSHHLRQWRMTAERWRELLKVYEPGGGISLFRFVCRHCRTAKYHLDFA